MKTKAQKYGDLLDTHALLQAYYNYSNQGVPAGCKANQMPMQGVPTWHRKQADMLLKELKGRQTIQARLSENSLRKWVSLVKRHPGASLFWFRDNLPQLLNQWQPANPTPVVLSPDATKMAYWLKQPVVRLLDGTEYPNDRVQHHFIAGPTDQILECFLTGIRLNLRYLEDPP